MSNGRSLFVKLCGLKTAADVEVAAGAGADAVGFVMTPSVRQLDLNAARRLVASVPNGVASVAVFYRPDKSFLATVRDTIPFDYFQAEPESLRGVEGIRAFPVVHDSEDLESRVGEAFELAANRRVLVESSGKGGSGVSPDWGRVATLSRLSEVVVAGGLTLDNVAETVEILRPGGVDVSSGIESSRGVEAHGLMKELVGAAGQAAARLRKDPV